MFPSSTFDPSKPVAIVDWPHTEELLQSVPTLLAEIGRPDIQVVAYWADEPERALGMLSEQHIRVLMVLGRSEIQIPDFSPIFPDVRDLLWGDAAQGVRVDSLSHTLRYLLALSPKDREMM